MRIAVLALVLATAAAGRAADPTTPNPAAALNAVGGYGRMMDKAMDDVMAAVAKNDPNAFVVGYARYVKNYEKLVDKLLEAEAGFGHAEVKLNLASASVARLKASKPTAADDWGKLRSAVVEQIRATRERHRAACTAAEKAALEAELGELMAHLDDLRRWADGEWATAERPSAEQLRKLEKCHAALATGFEREERMHRAVVSAVSTRLNQLPDELRAAATIIRTRTELPAEQLAKIRRQREQVRLFLDDLKTASKPADKPAAPTPAPADVLGRVDELLKPAVPTANPACAKP